MQVHAVCLEDNPALLDWLHEQSLAAPLTCLGDGHDRIWNLSAQVTPEVELRKTLNVRVIG